MAASSMDGSTETCLGFAALSDPLTTTKVYRGPVPARLWRALLRGALFCSSGMLLLGGFAPVPLQAQVAYFSGVVTSLGGGFDEPNGVAVDASGNIFVADGDGNAVKEIPPGCSTSACVTTLGGDFNDPWGVAVDGNGNVYVADYQNNAVKVMPPNCTSAAYSSGACTITILGGGFIAPTRIAVDGNGNVYVGDAINTHVVQEIPQGCTAANCVTTLGGGFSDPFDVALDGSGNLYVADYENNAVKMMPLNCTSAAYSSGACTITTLGGGFDHPTGVAVDATGNVYIADSLNNAVKEMPPGCLSSSCVTSLGGGFGAPYGVAVDASGNVYVAENNGSGTVQKIFPPGHGGNFGAVPVGSSGPTLSLYFTFTAGDEGITVSAMTQGATGLDFTDPGTGTCDIYGTIHTYNVGDTCTVNVTFNPKFAGARYGAVQLSDATGVIATAYIYGTGEGPELVFPNNLATWELGGGFANPFDVAVDASGNVYVADTGNGVVKEIPASCVSSSCVTTLGGSQINSEMAYGVAVDGAGNVYLADAVNNAVKKMPPGCASSSCVTTLGGGFNSPLEVAVDGAGNVYVTDDANNAVKEIPPGCASSSCVVTLGGGFTNPAGVAVDGAGNVYVSDNPDAVKEMPPGCASSSCVTTLGGGFHFPFGLAVDGAGNVYVVDSANNAVKEMPAGCASSACVTTLSKGFDDPLGVALDGAGNVYVTQYYGFFSNYVTKLTVASPPSLTFAKTSVGSQSTDSPQTVVLRNIGNAPLTFPIPGMGENPSTSVNFTLDSATTCPQVLTSSLPGTLAAGATCTLALDFNPTTAGLINGTAVLADNNLNVSSAMQTINLSGTGTSAQDATSTTVSVNPGSLIAGQAVTITAKVVDITNSGTTPTGSVTFTDSLNGGSPVALNGGNPVNLVSGTASLSGVLLAQGSHVISASYAGVSGTFLSSSGNSSTVTVGADVPAGASAPTATNFGTVPVASSSKQSVTFTFTAAGVIGAPLVVTQGATGLDFTDAGDGTCNALEATHVFNANDTCTVDADFTPKVPGLRMGAVLLEDGSGNVLATANVYGVGSGPQLVYDPGIITTIAGSGTSGYSGDGGPAISAKLSYPAGVAVDSAGNVYIADLFNKRIREVNASTGIISTIAGNGTYGYSGDGGPATSAEISDIGGVAVDGVGNVYIADFDNNRIRKVNASTGIISTIAGNGTQGYSGDGGPATNAELYSPQGVAVDGAGNVYIADLYNQRIREVNASTGIISTIAGNGTQGYGGDGGPAASAELYYPYGVAVDGAGNVYIADLSNQRIREVNASTGIISTIAGNGTQGYSGDGGAATSAELSNPFGLAVDGAGNVYIADQDNRRIREVNASTGIISTIAGNGTSGYSGDSGAATSAELGSPWGVALDGTGNVYFADEGNQRIREVSKNAASLSFASTNLGSRSSDSPQTVMLQNIGNAPLTFPTPSAGGNPSVSANFTLDSSTTCPEVLTSSSPGTLAAGATCNLAMDFIPTTTGPINGTAVLTDNNLNVSSATQTINLNGTGLNSTVSVSIGTSPAGLSFSVNGTPYSSTQTPSLIINTQYTLSTTSPQTGGPGVQYVFSQWSDGTASLTDLLTPTASTSSDTAQFTPQYMLTVTAGSGGTIAPSTAPNAFYNPATLQPIAATPNAGYYFVGWTGANSPGDISSATSASTSVTMNGPEVLTANFAAIPNLQVTTLNDDATGIPANCTTPSPNCSLRDAITAVQSINGSTGNISFASGLVGTITLTSALPTLIGQMTITGPGASSLTVSGGNSQAVGSVFTLNPGATVALSGVTISGGNSVNGGGITNNGSLTVSNSTLSGNTGGCGGAICNLIGVAQSAGVGNLTLSGSTISGNHANFNGGAIVNSGALIVVDSTISGNSAGYDYGGGIYNANGTLTVANSTISGNTSGQYGGGIFNAAVVTISNSIVAGNTASGNPGDDCDRCGNQSSNNLITTPSNIINPNLASLGNYGGATQTMLPLPGSAAICAASSALIPPGVTTDQRGFTNYTTYNNTTCYDLGAVQTNYGLSFGATQQPPSTGTLPSLAMSPAPAVTLTENGNPLTAGSATVNVTDSNSDLTTSPATATTSSANGQAVFSNLIFSGATSNDTLTATLALNPNNGLILTTISTSFSVAAATPTVTWPTANSITYGQPLASSTLSGGSAVVGSTPVLGSFTFANPSTIPNAGTQTESVTFTPSNTSAYNSVSGTVSVLVNKAMPTVTFTGAPASAPYQGTFVVTAKTNASTTAVISASGSCSVSGSTVTVTTSSGTCLLTATWPADNDFLAGSATQSTAATKATPLLTWPAPAAITYGTALSATQLNATATNAGNTVPGTFAYSPAKGTVLGAGHQTISVTFTPSNTTNFTSASTSVVLQVNQATPKITWAKPAAITYGTALSNTQLDATASVPGTLVYSPPAGTILAAGTQTLSVTFTPSDAVDYTAASDSVTMTVKQATPIVTWGTPAAIVYGTPLSNAQLDATASVAGTFVYSPASGTIEPAGTDKLSVTFTPTDAVDYTTATTSVTLSVGVATPVINWPTPAAITYGTALSTTQLNATATNAGSTVAGTFSYTPAKGTVLGVGHQTLSVTFTPSNTTNFATASTSVVLQVNQATPKITWAKPAAITYGTALSNTQLDATASVPGTLVYSPAVGTILAGGTQPLSVSFSPTDLVDYTTATDSVSITVNQTTSTTAITKNTPDPSVEGQAVTVSFSVSGANGVPTGIVTVTASTGQSCSGTLTSGSGNCSLTFTASGSPKLTAVYSGDANFKASTSAKVTQTVQP